MARKVKEALDFQTALQNLAVAAQLHEDSLAPKLGGRMQLLAGDEEGGSAWIAEEGGEPFLEVLDETYKRVARQLAQYAEEDEEAALSLMALVGESAVKMDAFFSQRQGKSWQKVESLPSFQELQYLFKSRFEKKLERPTGESALQDFQAVKLDRDYELFIIQDEAGQPHFNEKMLQNVKLACDFRSEDAVFSEDPLLKIRSVLDRDLHFTAAQILRVCHPHIAKFFQLERKLRKGSLAQYLNQALFALFLAANPRHLLQNTSLKNCQRYFQDFQRFLRQALTCFEYQKLVAYVPSKADKAAHLLLQLSYSLSSALFARPGGVKQETIGLLHRAAREGGELQAKQLKSDTLWNRLLLEDEKIRTFFSKFPNGPLLKTLEQVRFIYEEEEPISFDPIWQGNLPTRLFRVESKAWGFDVSRLPCPTSQRFIYKAVILDEFRAALRENPKEKWLVINLQERTSWKEEARCRALESLQKSEPSFAVLTMPKEGDFYYQSGKYLNQNAATDFFIAFRSEIKNGSTFSFPSFWQAPERESFTDRCMAHIHKGFFASKNVLSRREREDFIEIFYQFLILKAIEMFSPDRLSFTCKDAVDTSAVESAIFFAFLKYLSGGFSKVEDVDLFRNFAYAPALLVRERAVDGERFSRALSCLETLFSEELPPTDLLFKPIQTLHLL